VLKIKGGSVKKAVDRRFLNGHLPLPYHLRAGRYQCFGQPNTAAHPQKPGPMAGFYIQQSLNGGLPMATYDLAPFYRSTVGFDRFFSLLDQAAAGGSPGYPPYNIERTGENAYRITVAVSGFSQGELSIVAKENTLTIKGEKSANENGQDKSEVLYRGIAARAFERAFQLADFVVVKSASLENGLLHVDLVREIPEAKKPRNIPISTKAEAAQVVEGSTEKAAA
jgi:molecular chaperone IbpA